MTELSLIVPVALELLDCVSLIADFDIEVVGDYVNFGLPEGSQFDTGFIANEIKELASNTSLFSSKSSAEKILTKFGWNNQTLVLVKCFSNVLRELRNG